LPKADREPLRAPLSDFHSPRTPRCYIEDSQSTAYATRGLILLCYAANIGARYLKTIKIQSHGFDLTASFVFLLAPILHRESLPKHNIWESRCGACKSCGACNACKSCGACKVRATKVARARGRVQNHSGTETLLPIVLPLGCGVSTTPSAQSDQSACTGKQQTEIHLCAVNSSDKLSL
jgi:hypothetical protein